jgi:hypothetical protein
LERGPVYQLSRTWAGIRVAYLHIHVGSMPLRTRKTPADLANIVSLR